jgi:acetyl esterase/lipase
MLHLPFISRGAPFEFPLPPVTPEMLALSTDFTKPPTGTPAPIAPADFMKPRGLMELQIFKTETITEFLLRELLKTENRELSLPEKGSVSDGQIEEISPLHIVREGKVRYPPTYQILGREDECFGVEHVVDFDGALREKGGESTVVVLEGMGHAFDAWVDVGSVVDEGIIRPAVEWIAGFAGVKS